MELSKPTLINRDEVYFLKIDNGDHYFLGEVKQTDFPNDIKNYIEVIEKSLVDYNDEHEIILSKIQNSNIETDKSLIYLIDYKISYGSFTRNFSVNITMKYFLKEQIDYINERLVKLESKVILLNDENSNLLKQIKEISEQLNKINDIDHSVLKSSETEHTVSEPVVYKRKGKGS